MIKKGASLSPDPVYDKFRTQENYKSSEILRLWHITGDWRDNGLVLFYSSG